MTTAVKKSYRDLIGKRQERSVILKRRDLVIDEAARTVELAFASETPVERWFGDEILSCASRAVMLDRLNAGGALLSDHNTRAQVGAVVRDSAKVDGDKICRATVKFSERQAGEDEFKDVKADIRTNVSVGYVVHEYTVDADEEVYTATRWEPLEISLVSIPADTSVGVGRSAGIERGRDDETEDPAGEDQETSQEKAARAARERTPTKPQTIEVRSMEPTKEEVKISEVARATEIMDLAKVIDAPGETLAQEVARDAIAQNKTLPEFRQMVFEKRESRGKDNPTPLKQAKMIELSEREKSQFSITRAILADANMRDPNMRGDTQCLELDISQEIEKRLDAPGYKRRGGILIPSCVALRGVGQVQQRSGLDTATDTKGQELVFTEAGSFIDLLRKRAKVLMLGATVLPGLQGNVAFPKQIGAGTFSWVGENPGSDVAESNLTLDQVTLSPKTGQSTTSYSRQLLAQSVVNIDGLVMSDLAKITALALDLAAIHGAGSANQPRGVYATSGIGSVTFGGAITFAKVVDMETAIAAADADIGTMAYLTTPNIRGTAKKTLEAASAGAKMIWQNGEMNGYRAEATNQVSKTLGSGSDHGIIFGVWEELLFGEWGAVEIITDPYRLKKQGMIEVTNFVMIDIALRHAEAFCKGATLVP